MNPAMQQALQSAEASAKQNNAGNPMDMNAMHFATGGGTTAELGNKSITKGVGSTTIQDVVDQGNLAKSFAPEINALKNAQTVDNSAKINGQVGTVAPSLQQSNLGGGQQQGGQSR